MPRKATRKHLPRDIYSPAQSDQVKAVFESDLLFDMSEVLAAESDSGGFPDLMLFGIACSYGVFGSQALTLRHLRADGVWSEICGLYIDLVGQAMPLPTRPPEAHHMDRFIARIASKRRLRRRILRAFTESSVEFAIRLGNFAHRGSVNLAAPDPANMVFGDGAFYQPWSNVKRIVDPVTGEEHFVGSKAEKTPRVQEVVTDAGRDGKGVRGINHVTISTWTSSGWIVLMVDQALKSETTRAVAMLISLKRVIGKGLIWGVWDRAIRGASRRRLADSFGIEVIGKESARSKKPAGEVLSHITHETAIKMYEDGQPLPLGVSVYRKSRGHDVVNSKFLKLGHFHQGGCAHELYVDDAALVVAVPGGPNNSKLKVARATALESSAEDGIGEWSDTFTNRVTWTLPCPDQAGVDHSLTTVWHPAEGCFFAESATGEFSGQGLKDLRALSRSDEEAFLAIHGYRNIAEALHAWFKARLGTTKNRGRATRLDQHQQLIHHLGLCVLANAITERAARFELK